MGIFDKRHGNGHTQPLAPIGGDVPILGLPCAMRAISVTHVLTCNCEAKTLLFVQCGPGGGVKCRACKRVFVFAGIVWKIGGQPAVDWRITVDTADAVDHATGTPAEDGRELRDAPLPGGGDGKRP